MCSVYFCVDGGIFSISLFFVNFSIHELLQIQIFYADTDVDTSKSADIKIDFRGGSREGGRGSGSPFILKMTTNRNSPLLNAQRRGFHPILELLDPLCVSDPTRITEASK